MGLLIGGSLLNRAIGDGGDGMRAVAWRIAAQDE